MAVNIVPFHFESSDVRVVMIDSNPWFVLADVLKALGSSTRTSQMKPLIEDVLGEGCVIVIPLETEGGKQSVLIMNEPALTYTVSRSRTEIGKRLSRWIHTEVLPAIRKTGTYSINQKPKTAIELARENLKLAEQQVALLEKIELIETEKAILESENEKLAEAVDELFEYSSIIRVAKYNDVNETSFSWRLLKAASNKLGVEIKKVPCPRYGEKNLYSHQAWRLAYPEYKLPETTTLVIVNKQGE